MKKKVMLDITHVKVIHIIKLTRENKKKKLFFLKNQQEQYVKNKYIAILLNIC